MRTALSRPKWNIGRRRVKTVLLPVLVAVGLLLCLVPLMCLIPVLSASPTSEHVAHRVARRNADIESNSTCACELESISSQFLRLSQLRDQDPYEPGSSYEVLVRRHPNLGSFMLRNKSHCSILPFVTSLNWNGVWQVTAASPSAQYKLYSAACDPHHAVGACSVVRILAMAEAKVVVRPHCHFWSDTDDSPLVVRAGQPEFLDYQGANNRLVPYLLTCPVPRSAPRIAGVSVSIAPCSTVTNFLQVSSSASVHAGSEAAVRVSLHPPTSDLNVGVCGPALFYYHTDVSTRIVEWIEILKALGFAKVFLYVTKVHPNVEKVLRFYEKQGFVKVTLFSYPSPYIDDPILRRAWVGVQRSEMFGLENIYFSDCLLRNKDEFRYLLHLDPDELPMLGQYDSVHSFVKSITRKYQKHPANFRLFWKTFHEDTPPGDAVKDLPPQFFFLRHDSYRRDCVKEACGKFKTLYDTRHTVAAYSHKALICKGPCRRVTVSSKKAYIAHYRRDCSGAACKDPDAFTTEIFLHAFKKKVERAVNGALRLINLT